MRAGARRRGDTPAVAEANVEALRRGYDALNRGDLSVVLELLDPELEWHEPGDSPEAGEYRGRESFERFLRGWIESFDDFRVEPEQVVERGDELIAVVRQRGRGRSSGVEVEIRIAHVWTVEDGRAVRWSAVPRPEDALG
jgi:ketosteroid isomerase-like protein